MELLDKLKLWYTCKKDGRMEEYENYKQRIDSLKADIVMYNTFLNRATQKFAEIQQKFPEDSREYIDAKDEVHRWQHTLEERKLELKFIRPNSQQDIEYREEQCKTFVNNLQSVLSPDLDLRFHGTPIYFAEQIIKSGTISSTADRYDGYVKSTDMRGEISASNVKSLGRTINFFSDMVAYQRGLPAGCIFALLPKDQADATYGHDLMHSVDFRQNPEQFFGVFTTPENIERVQEWMSESGFDPNSVYTFEGFLQAAKAKSEIIDDQAKSKDNKSIDKTEKSSKGDDTLVNMNTLVRNALEQGIITSEINEADKVATELTEPKKEETNTEKE